MGVVSNIAHHNLLTSVYFKRESMIFITY